jgi:cytochrome b
MQRRGLKRERVYDPVLRLLHAWNALLIVLLIASAQAAGMLDFDWPAATLWRLHLWLGYGLVLGLAARLIWGLSGPEHARWRALWHPRAWHQALASRRVFTAPSGPGHHPLASGVYLVVYGLLIVMAATGLALAAIDQNTGPLHAWLGHDVFSKPLFRRPHEWLQYLFMAYILIHLAALVLHQRRHGVPVAQAMVTGDQYFKEKP